MLKFECFEKEGILFASMTNNEHIPLFCMQDFSSSEYYLRIDDKDKCSHLLRH